jgi:hypothetical protein
MDALPVTKSLTAEDLLAGAAATHTIAVPGSVLGPNGAQGVGGQVTLRPLTVRDVQRVAQAAREQRLLTSVLMVQQSLVSPKLTIEQTGSLSAGLVEFLLARVNEISGLKIDAEDLDQAIRAPLARACFVLSREFGWTPSETASLTVGQILLYLEMLAGEESAEGAG